MPETQPIHSNAIATEVRDKEPERQAIADAVAAFKAKGGKVQVSPAEVPDKEMAEIFKRLKAKERSKPCK